MKTWRVALGAAMAAMIVAMGSPSPAAAQLGGLKKKLKAKLMEAVVEQATAAVSPKADTAVVYPGAGSEAMAVAHAGANPVVKKPVPGAPARPGPTFTDFLLEMTPELLDRFAKGLAAEQAVRQDIERIVGKQLPREQYDQCFQAVVASPEGQKLYMSASDLINGDASQEQLRAASQELARRFEVLSKPKCGLDPMKAQEVREAHRVRLQEAAPSATGLTVLQLSILKERILPFCAAVDALVKAAGEARLSAGAEAIFWVYGEAEAAALQPRCASLMPVLRTSL